MFSSKIYKYFWLNTKDDFGIHFNLKKEKPELAFLVSLVFNKNIKDFINIIFIYIIKNTGGYS
jgi:hypothetical protein